MRQAMSGSMVPTAKPAVVPGARLAAALMETTVETGMMALPVGAFAWLCRRVPAGAYPVRLDGGAPGKPGAAGKAGLGGASKDALFIEPTPVRMGGQAWRGSPGWQERLGSWSGALMS